MDRIRARLASRVKSKKGATLIETIVTICIISILMLMIGMAVSNFFSAYYKITSLVRAGEISNVIQTELEDIIQKASNVDTYEAKDEPSGKKMWISADGLALYMTDAEGRPLEISAMKSGGDKELNLKYYFNDTDKATDYYKASAFYHGNDIEIAFKRLDEQTIDVTVKVLKGSETVSTRSNVIRLLDTVCA